MTRVHVSDQKGILRMLSIKRIKYENIAIVCYRSITWYRSDHFEINDQTHTHAHTHTRKGQPMPTLAIRHRVEEAPWRVLAVAWPHKGHVVARLDAHHRHQVHVDPGNGPAAPGPPPLPSGRRPERRLLVAAPPLVLVGAPARDGFLKTGFSCHSGLCRHKIRLADLNLNRYVGASQYNIWHTPT